MPPLPRLKSEVVFTQLIMGRATAAEYVAAVREESRRSTGWQRLQGEELRRFFARDKGMYGEDS